VPNCIFLTDRLAFSPVFDKLKLRIASFKSDITKRYKLLLEIFQILSDTVPMVPILITEVLTSYFSKIPDTDEFIEVQEQIIPEIEETVVEEASNGFIINNINSNEEDEI